MEEMPRSEPRAVNPELKPELTKEFDLERFRAELTRLTEAYAEAAYITYGRNPDMAAIEVKKARAEGLLVELVDLCARAFRDANKNCKAVTDLVEEIVVNYRHSAGPELFAEKEKATFYRELAIKIAQIK